MLSKVLKSLPYTVHTNRELGLLLSGQKPFSAFVDAQGRYPEVVLRYLRLFDRHVRSGVIIRRDHIERLDPQSPYQLHRIMFALPGEEWRFEAYLELWDSKEWGKAEERAQGELLGYEDWMNDHWISLKYSD
ncbi:MAG: hypothetical protein AAFQ13_04300 [Pseudomonadota bacterium]